MPLAGVPDSVPVDESVIPAGSVPDVLMLVGGAPLVAMLKLLGLNTLNVAAAALLIKVPVPGVDVTLAELAPLPLALVATIEQV